MADLEIEKELVLINALLRSREFSFEIAAALNAAYDNVQPEPSTAAEELAVTAKTVRSEKIATNLAGFYALECGIGFLCEQRGGTPAEWLRKIVDKTADSDAVSLLNRFANATWKAGQPFRGLDRIARYNFTVAALLLAEEIEKDLCQIDAAASFLLQHMQEVQNGPIDRQMEQLRSLLQDTRFAFHIAAHIHTTYHARVFRSAPEFLGADDDTTYIQKSVKEEQVAINLAGFYALECGMNYLVTCRGDLPSDLLKAIVNDMLSDDDKTLLLRFANATWKAGQPYRDLGRITRENFTPVYFLTPEEIEKDMVQIKAAAQKLLEGMQRLQA